MPSRSPPRLPTAITPSIAGPQGAVPRPTPGRPGWLATQASSPRHAGQQSGTHCQHPRCLPGAGGQDDRKITVTASSSLRHTRRSQEVAHAPPGARSSQATAGCVRTLQTLELFPVSQPSGIPGILSAGMPSAASRAGESLRSAGHSRRLAVPGERDGSGRPGSQGPPCWRRRQRSSNRAMSLDSACLLARRPLVPPRFLPGPLPVVGVRAVVLPVMRR